MPTLTATATPTPPPCSPRPPLSVAATPTGDGGLRVTLSATTNASTPTNRLVRMLGGLSTNVGTVAGDFGVQPPPFDYTFPAGTRQTTLVVRRATPGQAATLRLVVVDGCGDWPTFVGGGPSAF
ncbi:MAG TPA: hypothetical protein VFE37_28900 [Chloroflexota bacterium]|nr:hypothetical protein [Chloroflexota bacterium]